jgi:hypothetical protein
MHRVFVLLALLVITPALSLAQVAKELVGRYQMEVPAGDILELRADGSATLGGEEMRWSAKGNRLSVGTDVMQYTLQDNRLMVMFGAIPIAWKKISGTAKTPSPMEKAARSAVGATPAATGNEQDVQARQVLTNSAWCSFTYNKISGTSTTRKVVFRRDGVMTINGGAETYSSGYGGSYAGQSNSGGAMRWKLENLRLLIDQGSGTGFQDIGLTATQNSNGSVILRAEGREYAMCN